MEYFFFFEEANKHKTFKIGQITSKNRIEEKTPVLDRNKSVDFEHLNKVHFDSFYICF